MTREPWGSFLLWHGSDSAAETETVEDPEVGEVAYLHIRAGDMHLTIGPALYGGVGDAVQPEHVFFARQLNEASAAYLEALAEKALKAATG